ncbi:unnamed protein product [Nezara viridula]|uniref:Uncharacterized protein n=1 Tax=Nezara viridula TaxID=85310 RepID=A0A9P0GZU1_NEZVI|nr:unnamed protein product [Nezara viridula]
MGARCNPTQPGTRGSPPTPGSPRDLFISCATITLPAYLIWTSLKINGHTCSHFPVNILTGRTCSSRKDILCAVLRNRFIIKFYKYGGVWNQSTPPVNRTVGQSRFDHRVSVARQIKHRQVHETNERQTAVRRLINGSISDKADLNAIRYNE